ncbi:MAG TPA: ABC transporter substrate-binding protein [Candidatus Polarisedimenticolia bacterium]|jgi:peptide/nickel transport system substrate-binding protein/oligopeptide transport system substrate-binding protein|nr:ABC transporter substrate-binding protein [Candidatus Polarisedimenticolia bacterium]
MKSGHLPVLAILATAVLPGLACGRSQPPAAPAEQVYRFRLHEDPPTLDPALANDQFSEAIILNVHRGLVELDPETLEIRPAVAESWTISPDGRTYTFHLRAGATFHNGRTATAADVVYSFERILRKETNSPRRFLLEPIEGAREFTAGTSASIAGVSTPDDRTVEVRLSKPFSPFLSQLTMTNIAIVPKEAYDDPQKAYLRAPVGCGPFRFSRWEQGNFIELLAFDRYYGGRPAIDRVVVRMIENWTSALQEYLAGGLDSLDEVPDDSDTAMIAKVGPEIRRYPFIGTGYIGFNMAVAPFRGNIPLRQAFNYAVDKHYLWEVLMPGNLPANGIIPPGIPGHDPDLPGYPHDEAKARSLLARAGYPAGKGLPPIALWVNTGEDNRRIAEQVQSDLKKIGVDLTVREVDWAAYIAGVSGTAGKPGQAQMFRFGWYLDYPDADAILRPLLHSSNWGPAGNFGRYKNAQVDAIIDQALDTADPHKRADLYRRAERIAVMEDPPWIFLSYYQSKTLYKPYVKGVVLSPLGEFRLPLDRLRIERGAT